MQANRSRGTLGSQNNLPSNAIKTQQLAGKSIPVKLGLQGPTQRVASHIINARSGGENYA